MGRIMKPFFSILVLICCFGTNAFTPTIPHQTQQQSSSSSMMLSMMGGPKKGCGAKPYNKKKIAIFGIGGYMGATIFGFLQRASAIYGTGITSPRAICATPIGSEGLNKILGRSFKLAFAGEDMIRLTNMEQSDAICTSLKGMNGAILGTIYQLEQKSVALNTYEKTPNDKTFEFYLDDRYAADNDVSSDDMDFHLSMFQRSVDACVQAGLEHMLVIETPNTKDCKPFLQILDKANIPFTYLHVNGKLENTKLYTFEEGIQSKLEVKIATVKKNSDWMNNNASIDAMNNDSMIIAREDVAALAVQSLLCLDWMESKCLNVVSTGERLERMSEKEKSKLKSDKDWCINSDVLAEALMNQ
jgi:hypothetical protein